MLELILFYGIPYKDTNPIAHKLINRFGSIENILKTKTEALTEISNVGVYTADFLHTLDRVRGSLSLSDKSGDASPKSYKSVDEMGRFLCSYVKAEKAPSSSVLYLNNSFEIIGVKKLLTMSKGIHLLKTEDVVSEFIRLHASFVIIFQHKYNSIALPDFEDVCSASKLKSTLELSQIRLLEFFVVTENDYSPVFLKSKGMIKGDESLDFPMLSASDGYDRSKLESVSTESVLIGESTPKDDLALLCSLLRFASKNHAEKLASELLSRFGSLNKVFSAKLDSLMQIDGVNENIATLIRLVGATNQYLLEKTPPSFSLTDTDKILLFLARLFASECDESLIILLFDKNGSFIKHKRISSGGSNFVLLSAREILEFALREKAAGVIMSHNHPDGIAVPSLADKEATSVTRQLLSQVGIKLVAHYIIAGDQYSDCLNDSDR
ncbi:MAG: hypothetical protein IIX94_01810 [Clostridia bacterium]|nr:hypothetical protein [Clostridia bacterium]